MKRSLVLLALFALTGYCQVQDVNGDDTVGAEEVLAVAESWKGPAGASNEHDHIGQVWTNDRGAFGSLSIRGSYPSRIVPSPVGQPAVVAPRAPLILENTATSGGFDLADLILGGHGLMAAVEEEGSELTIAANRRVFIHFDANNSGLSVGDGQFVVLNGERREVLNVDANGKVDAMGDVNSNTKIKSSASVTRIDHPLHPKNKTLNHASVICPEMKTVYDGTVVLNGEGESYVDLPEYFESLNGSFRYQLTCVGGYAPVYVAEEIVGNQFKIAGGKPGMKVSWMVTGIRQDAFAKANPIVVEKEKLKDKDGKSR